MKFTKKSVKMTKSFCFELANAFFFEASDLSQKQHFENAKVHLLSHNEAPKTLK